MLDIYLIARWIEKSLDHCDMDDFSNIGNVQVLVSFNGALLAVLLCHECESPVQVLKVLTVTWYSSYWSVNHTAGSKALL